MLLLLDSYDSFTWNLAHYLGELGAEVAVHRNDALPVAAALALAPSHIVLSPGPCRPEQAGIMLDLIAAAGAARLPLLGVCLGHQGIGMAFGGRVVQAATPMHGKVSPLRHTNDSVFKNLPAEIEVARYHSLIVERASLPACLQITAETPDGTIMGLRHVDLPIHGVQFHPESIATEHGHAMLRNFLDG